MSGPLELSSYAEENAGREDRGVAVSQKTQMGGKLRRLS